MYIYSMYLLTTSNDYKLNIFAVFDDDMEVLNYYFSNKCILYGLKRV